MRIRIGTRGSDLALWQAYHVQDLLRRDCGAEVEIKIIKTQGDMIQDVPLTPDLGKSFFTKEIEQALLDREIDLAVHSLKDLAVDDTPGLALAAIPAREQPSERLLIHPKGFDATARPLPLRQGAIVGTSSPRRQRRLLEIRPDLEIRELRGNVPTRVNKCKQGEYDAILLAYAGVTRLAVDIQDLHPLDLPLDLLCGAAGQGALGLQTRQDDSELRQLLGQLEDAASARATSIERKLLKALGGGCTLPFGAYAQCQAEGPARLHAYLFAPEPGTASLRFEGQDENDEALVKRAAAALLPAMQKTLAGNKVLVLGGPQRPTLLGQMIAAGAEAQYRECFQYRDLPCPSDAMQHLLAVDHLLIASKNAALRLQAELENAGQELPPRTTLLVPGSATRELAKALFPKQEILVGEPPRSLGMGMLAVQRGAKRLFGVGAANGNDEGIEYARQAGIQAETLALYRSEPAPAASAAWPPELGEARGAFLLYLSPAAVRSAPPPKEFQGLRLLAIGPSTAHALEEAGALAYETLARPELSSLLACIESHQT